ncbi:MAG TPA: c-type cytochrome biogenesis protein CcmI [Candidatus Limnocylindria bacterium]|jgi:cytochrome c-type biogenesis protein CcmI
MAELLLLGLLVAAVALAVVWPLLDRPAAVPSIAANPEREALEVRHRLALEALRDVEADHRAGSLDDEGYRRERDEAERHAVETRRALDAAPEPAPQAASVPASRSLRLAALIGVALAALLLIGLALPAPFGVAERDARLERIRQLTDAVGRNPRDAAALAELSDLYLAGGTDTDVARALASLILLRNAAPDSRDANGRLVTLLVRIGSWDEAAKATDVYARVVGESDPDIPFFRGLIARGRGDAVEARQQFERFLQLAPGDDRAVMVRGLLDGMSPSPAPSG